MRRALLPLAALAALTVIAVSAVIDGLLSGTPHAVTWGLGALFGLGVGALVPQGRVR